MLRAALALFLFAAPATVRAAAQECGAVDAPCEVAGGIYHVALPDGPGPHPAVLFLHGLGGTGRAIVANQGLMRSFTQRGYAVIAPQGMPWRRNGDGGYWNNRADLNSRDDKAFVREVVADAARRFDLDRDRVLAAGFSAGGMMVWRIACDAPGTFQAYAPIAGLLWRPLPETCAGPVNLFHTHGWSDSVVPLEGRLVGDGRSILGDLFAGLAVLRRANGCVRDNPDSYGENGMYLIRRWTDCAPGAELEFALHPGGHKIPEGWADMALDWFENVTPRD